MTNGTYEVERLIEEASKSQSKLLRLGGLGLSELPESMSNLTDLVTLDLSDNHLTTLPKWVEKFSELRYLDLSKNALVTFPEAIAHFPQITSLSVTHNGITAVPEWVGDLSNLTLLNISHNEISSLPESICKLAGLQVLRVSANPLRLLPENIGQLSQLHTLSAYDIKATTLPASLGDLKHLKVLLLFLNPLVVLPESIGRLRQLEKLDLYDTLLSMLPESIGNLIELKVLDLTDNQLSALPKSLFSLAKLEELYLHDNPLGIPAEILGPGWQMTKEAKPASPRSILDFYFRTVSGIQQPLNEVKLLLVGRGGAGKTSIVRRLREGKFSRTQKETRGITINTWMLPCGDDEVRVNVWDFAGQVITHSTHHFFLTQRSVYILVLTGREDSQKTDAEYWLRLIKAFGTDRKTGETSPVIIALNKWALSKFRVDRNALKEKYPFIVDFIETDCKKGEGIDRLREALSSTVIKMDNVRKPFPASWWSIKERLESMKRSYLSYAEYKTLCQSLGENDPAAQRSLSTVLHALGIALNYADDSRLRDTTVLNPHWVTDCIYKLLREGVRDDGSGEMHMNDVARVLPKEKREMRSFLVELMRRFDLAFPLTEDHDQWLVPQRLPDEQPELDFNFYDPEGTRLCYRYSVLPEGLLARFITRTYPLSNGLPRWLNGVVLEDDGAKGLIRADIGERTITVVVLGPTDSQRRLIGLIRNDLKAIHDDIEGLAPEEYIELNHKPGVYANLQTLEADEQRHQPSAAATTGGTIQVDNTHELNRVSAPDSRDPESWKAKLFISYSNTDSRLLDELLVRLKPMKSEGLLESWSDRCLIAGQPWDGLIRKELLEADMVVFLQSTRFVASDYIQDVEVAQALQQAAEGKTVVVSVILEKCEWQRGKHGEQLKLLQALPPKAKPVRDTTPQRDAWHEVAVGVRNALENLKRQRGRQIKDSDVTQKLHQLQIA